jgi:hypothetical protein
MPLIWCSISAHGFGHAAQVVPVLNELGPLVPGLKVILRTEVPARFFEERLTIPWALSPARQDIGCVQRGPLQVDVEATWAAYRGFHADWDARVSVESEAIQAAAPDLVLANISHLAIESGSRAHVPTVGLCTLSWDGVLEPLHDPGRSDQIEIIRKIRQAYRLAEVMIRPAPALAMSAFQKVRDVGPIVRLVPPEAARLREAVGAGAHEQVALVAFGGIDIETLPFDRLIGLTGYRFVVSGTVPNGWTRGCAAMAIPLPFAVVMASADVVMSKPGYNTTTEVVAHGKPLVYVRRANFADEPALIEYLGRYGRAVELSLADFSSGNWEKALDAVLRRAPRHKAPAPTGAAEAAAILKEYV